MQGGCATGDNQMRDALREMVFIVCGAVIFSAFVIIIFSLEI
jgi:hypothetical protein